MLQYILDPFHTARLEPDIGIELADHGPIDNVLLLLLEQLDQPLFFADESLGLVDECIQESGNMPLFFNRRDNRRHTLEILLIKPVAVFHNAPRIGLHLVHVEVGTEQIGEVTTVHLRERPYDDIDWAHQPIYRRDTDRALPHAHGAPESLYSG